MSTDHRITPVYVAGNDTIHAGRVVGRYPSGNLRYAKCCSSSRNDRHDPMPLAPSVYARPESRVTCKRCIAKLAKRG